MTRTKRTVDLVLALLLAPTVILILGVLLAFLLIVQGRPLFYGARRVRAPGQMFTLWKLRTMSGDTGAYGVCGGHKARQITRAGRWLRAHRLDELPQLWNVVKGDMSFVGPRPPAPEYVNRFPNLYAKILRNRPGITGLGTLLFYRQEAALLSRCRTALEADETYCGICVPRKARLDLIYQQNQSILLDFGLMFQTARMLLLPLAKRPQRLCSGFRNRPARARQTVPRVTGSPVHRRVSPKYSTQFWREA